MKKSHKGKFDEKYSEGKFLSVMKSQMKINQFVDNYEYDDHYGNIRSAKNSKTIVNYCQDSYVYYCYFLIPHENSPKKLFPLKFIHELYFKKIREMHVGCV